MFNAFAREGWAFSAESRCTLHEYFPPLDRISSAMERTSSSAEVLFGVVTNDPFPYQRTRCPSAANSRNARLTVILDVLN